MDAATGFYYIRELDGAKMVMIAPGQFVNEEYLNFGMLRRYNEARKAPNRNARANIRATKGKRNKPEKQPKFIWDEGYNSSKLQSARRATTHELAGMVSNAILSRDNSGVEPDTESQD